MASARRSTAAGGATEPGKVRDVDIVGLFDLGTSFGIDGSIITIASPKDREPDGPSDIDREQLEATLKLQVQPLRPFLQTLARHTCELARSLGKEVEVTTSGGQVQLDRRILEAIREAALHLVHNAVDHGIEEVAERRAAGKDSVGAIHLGAETDGDRVRLVVEDDGAGVNLDAVRKKAIARGLLGENEDVDPRELGFEVHVFAMVGLQSQAEADLRAFEDRCRAWPLVRECHMLNGEVDFILKCVAPDLSSFQNFLTGELLTAPNVESVKTSLVIRSAKDDPGVPFDVMEDRLKRSA